MSDTRFELYYLEWQPAIASCSTISGSGNSSARSWNFARVCHKYRFCRRSVAKTLHNRRSHATGVLEWRRARTRPICSQYYLCDERKSPVWPQKCHRVDGPVPSQSRGACGALEEGQSSPRKDDLRVRAERFGGQRQPDEKPQDTFEENTSKFLRKISRPGARLARKKQIIVQHGGFLPALLAPPAGKRTGRHTEQPTFESMKQKKKKVNEKNNKKKNNGARTQNDFLLPQESVERLDSSSSTVADAAASATGIFFKKKKSVQTPGTPLERLDAEMNEILLAPGTDEREKWTRYSAVLQRYLQLKERSRDGKILYNKKKTNSNDDDGGGGGGDDTDEALDETEVDIDAAYRKDAAASKSREKKKP
ncbi:unnamed protein product [Trichogramma brassicae]|uniref:Uncharacterized protein n=1 Tax=Trichogramma brassicae TaxID=86971 RepID=A0A6H5HZL1_9HYME|nr:unnamed protein product [Trichogramma brassicae]